MTDSKSPQAVRVSRPFGTEEELLQHEGEAISKGGIVLLGAPQRPDGAVLRFEVTLSDGKSVMRGEGRVVGMKTVAGQSGLALRFTRLDSKSKALVDRATALRARPPVVPAAVQSEPVLEVAPSEPKVADPAPSVVSLPTPPAEEPPTEPHAASAEPPTEPTKKPGISRPGDREAVLARLRERATRLSVEQVTSILAVAKR